MVVIFDYCKESATVVNRNMQIKIFEHLRNIYCIMCSDLFTFKSRFKTYLLYISTNEYSYSIPYL